jgi:hypothetical protein
MARTYMTPARALVGAFPLDSWLLAIVYRMLRRNQRSFSQRLKWRKTQRRFIRN